MEKGKWNVGGTRHETVPVVQVVCAGLGVPEIPCRLRERLLLLSHRIAISGTPAVFKEWSDERAPVKTDGPVVVVYDIFRKFDSHFTLPFWCEVQRWQINADENVDAEMMVYLQRAYTLFALYEFKHLSPLYFTSFLLFPGNVQFPEPFVFQMVPVIRERAIVFRSVVAGNIEAICGSTDGLRKDDCALMPPNEYPFIVNSVSERFVEVRDIGGDETTTILKSRLRKVVVMCRTPAVFYDMRPIQGKFFGPAPVEKEGPLEWMSVMYNRESDSFFDKVTTFYDHGKDDIDELYDQLCGGGERCESSDEISVIDAAAESYLAMINDEVGDKKTREILISVSGEEVMFPNCYRFMSRMRVPVQSVFQSDLPAISAQQPRYTRQKCLAVESEIEGIHLGKPVVNAYVNGIVTDIPAQDIVMGWEERHTTPISGPKRAMYAVFYFNTVDRTDVMDFFEGLRSAFTNHEFGRISPMPKHAYVQIKGTCAGAVETYFGEERIAEFRKVPTLTFVVCPKGVSLSLNVHSQCIYVSEDDVQLGNVKRLETLAFTVYSQIRVLKTAPFGVLNRPPASIAPFFVHRYQPPYTLKGEGDASTVLSLHICWDPASSYISWADDIGSLSEAYENQTISDMFERLNGIRRELVVAHIDVTVCVLGEMISSECLNELRSCFDALELGFSLFSVFPAACVQVTFDEYFDDDVLVFASGEQTCTDPVADRAIPDSTCFVVSPGLPAYTVSHYWNNASEPGRDRLEKFARKMSHLSWLAVSCTDNQRVTSFPPHLSRMLSVNEHDIMLVSRFPFVPWTRP